MRNTAGSARRAGDGGAGDSPGRFGSTATVEIDPRRVGAVRIAYNPRVDGSADPGEVVWTWVPYQEADGRGKDRPVLVIASEPGGTVLGVALTSKPHDDRWDVAIGSGPWDPAGRPSWVRLERVFRLHQGGVRRRGVALGEREFGVVAGELERMFGWRAGASSRAVAAAAGAGASGAAGSRADARPATRAGVLRRVLGRLFGRR
ncbi:type II toxin-antitoxin system PemK/MazF family toxin [Herbiconiux sp. KACC 21604]|uniref:type II toxin-antitoxin system PemK/MazF family toxin n=1 Tax=unclassified Herbiconiux TaxID=2618217 RepID=UPI0014928FA9|nr:type II toxin-antitoxin system PemK/MazF family toxin [Herbiconiux sp. SALV-R1]QJU54105.1 type II toxin-antitoxin system PemK/MazF family toxin [Herbiconiux sp. SALV-R1]WPO85156.1 type II toxin-antitoxin system PemK/MazF family toxin [Herbiconiux sp. KACC 21604]